MPRNNYIKYKSYLIRFYNNNNFNKKIYKKLKYHVNINNTQMLAKQLPILSDVDTYGIKGVYTLSFICLHAVFMLDKLLGLLSIDLRNIFQMQTTMTRKTVICIIYVA